MLSPVIALHQDHHQIGVLPPFHPMFLNQQAMCMNNNLNIAYSALPVHQHSETDFNANNSLPSTYNTCSVSSTPCLSGDSTPSHSDGLCSPQMSSTPVPEEEQMAHNHHINACSEHDVVSNSVDGTNNGNKSGKYNFL